VHTYSLCAGPYTRTRACMGVRRFTAMLVVFFVSAVAHELVMAVPLHMLVRGAGAWRGGGTGLPLPHFADPCL
jgi:hypothetical protein